MTKYAQSFKQQVIGFYLQNGKNRSLIHRHFCIRSNHNKINGLVVLGKKQKYSVEFKFQIIHALRNGGLSAESLIFALTSPIRKQLPHN